MPQTFADYIGTVVQVVSFAMFFNLACRDLTEGNLPRVAIDVMAALLMLFWPVPA